MDPDTDPGGPKTYGSGTLVEAIGAICAKVPGATRDLYKVIPSSIIRWLVKRVFLTLKSIGPSFSALITLQYTDI